ncbi:MAG: hypothetical protein OEU09_11420 [Rhodospirillales bacterium]|nr:hypothetical protein [Rhodospirillales bacterium]
MTTTLPRGAGRPPVTLKSTATGSGVGGALGFLLVWLGPQWNLFETPGPEIAAALTAAFGVVFTGIGGLVGRYLPAPRGGARAMLPFAVLLGLGACTLFGPAETEETRAWRLAAGYVYASIPAAEYAAHPAADPAIKITVACLDRASHGAIMAAVEALKAGDDRVGALLASAESVLASYRLEVLGDAVAALPNSAEELAKDSTVLALVAVRSFARMRAWRKGYVKPKLKAWAELGAAPSDAEWTEVLDRAEALHAAVQEHGG